MTTEVLTQACIAGGTVTFGSGRVWYLKAAVNPVSIVLERIGTGASIRKFTNVSAGFKFTGTASEAWTYLRLTSPSTQNIEIVIGDDDVVISNAVTIGNTVATTVGNTVATTVGNTVTTTDLNAGTLVDQPNVALPNATLTVIVPANINRRRVTIGSVSTQVGSFFLRAAGGANNLLEIQPGTFVELRTTASIAGRNDSGGALVAYVLEETA